MDYIKLVEEAFSQNKTATYPEFKAGDTITVTYKIKEGDKDRLQKFRGVVIQISGATPLTKTFTVRKQMEDGYQILEMQAPCVVTALASAVQPRYMTVNGIVTAFDKEVEVWGADRIDVPEVRIGKAGSPTSVFKAFPKQLKPAGETFEVSPEEAVELIVNKLKEKHII